jgi:predicted DNA-binding transcriptional regulator YafY
MTTTQIRTHITEGATVRVVYRRADGDIQERIVSVERVWVARNGATAFMGHCSLRGERRTFCLANVLYAAPATPGETVETFADLERQHEERRQVTAFWLPILAQESVLALA